MADLDFSEEIVIYLREREAIKATFGSTWIVVADGAAKGGFKTFEEAANYAFDTFPDTRCLIRYSEDQKHDFPFLFASMPA